jgi:hypothetical protein
MRAGRCSHGWFEAQDPRSYSLFLGFKKWNLKKKKNFVRTTVQYFSSSFAVLEEDDG